jgi:hypothetical protein
MKNTCSSGKQKLGIGERMENAEALETPTKIFHEGKKYKTCSRLIY